MARCVRPPLALVLTLVSLALTLVPALVIWTLFSDLMTSSVALLTDTTIDITGDLAYTIQDVMLAKSTELLNLQMGGGQTEVDALVAYVYTTDVLQMDLRPSHTDLTAFHTAVMSRIFTVVKSQPFFSYANMITGYLPPGAASGLLIYSNHWQAMLFDAWTNALNVRTLYRYFYELYPNMTTAFSETWYVNQTTAKYLTLLQRLTYPADSVSYLFTASGWSTDIAFNEYTGLAQVAVSQTLDAANGTQLSITVAITPQSISDGLAEQLSNSPLDRLVIFFRQPHGHMIGASHGEVFSADYDARFVNPIANPPNLSAFRGLTCAESTDPLIREACAALLAEAGSWPAIPEQQGEMVLNGTRYWVGVAHSNATLDCAVLMLKNRASVMDPVDAADLKVKQEVGRKKTTTYVVLAVTTVCSVIFPVMFGLWLNWNLLRLAGGMDQIARLHFGTAAAAPSPFEELHRFQSSFLQMERGLRAFAKFVPREVVRVLVAGDAGAEVMKGNELTVMFADIEGFSTIAETVAVEQLVVVCEQYFEAACACLVNHGGCIDKFIGDCIMAIWNAPTPVKHHERRAVTALLAMQEEVLRLHDEWRRRGLPALKFRAGVHTGHCLVGNFGCSYRVSYTCLGDSVNLASRLEAINKKFGTYICVSHATFQGCQDYFEFRLLSKVTVPGKSEVLEVYEALCARASSEAEPSSPFEVTSLADSAHSQEGRGFLAPPAGAHSPSRRSSAEVSMVLVSPRPGGEQVAYHWQTVDRTSLLQHAFQYEAAYHAAIRGDQEKARTLLTTPPLAVPDAAWHTLRGEVERHAGQPWDGVFYFREK